MILTYPGAPVAFVLFPHTVYEPALFREKLSAGVVVDVATPVVKRGFALPAVKFVTVPEELPLPHGDPESLTPPRPFHCTQFPADPDDPAVTRLVCEPVTFNPIFVMPEALLNVKRFEKFAVAACVAAVVLNVRVW